MKDKKGTSSSKFGIGGRFNHDSSGFYNSRLYEGLNNDADLPKEENLFPENLKNVIKCASSENMSDIPDNSVHLMITSPPYNVSKVYDNDLSLEEYLEMLNKVFSETYRVLVNGGRACINVANLGRKPYIPLSDYISTMMIDLGFNMRGEIIWNKAGSASPSTAWGSWMSAGNPILRDIHEYILVFSKGSYKRERNGKENTISKDQFIEWTKSIWEMNAVSAKKVGHPAPFPEALPYRLIQLYSFKNDIVLDPFIGSGTTGMAALKSDRAYIGYDNSQEYVDLAEKKLTPLKNQLKIELKFRT